MLVFEFVLLLLLGGVALALIAPRLRMPWPALLALAGAGLAFVPGVPDIALDPDLALALFVAPVLLDSAYDASLRDLRRNWAPVGGLVLGAVGVTVAAVAAVAHWIDPALPWPAAIALGAIVAPPDAAAAAAVLRQVRLPHRIKVILEGESLLNDASALLTYRMGVSATIGGITAWTAPLLALEAAAGLALGVALAKAYLTVIARIEDEAVGTVLGFIGTFGVWLLADRLQLSAVLTMVAFALTLARSASERVGARRRRGNYAVWEVAIFVVNVLAFMLVGLQLRGIVSRMDGHLGDAVIFALGVTASAIIVRFAWVMGFYVVMLRREPNSSVGGGLLIGWCGMRGIVTLAAALALPMAFPHRDLVVFASFSLVLGTLVVQGLTLRPLLSVLALPADDSVEQEVSLGRAELAQAALAALGDSPDEAADEARYVLEQEYRARADRGKDPGSSATGLPDLRRQLLAAERRCLVALRRDERIGDDAFHVLEEELDWAEAEAGRP